MAEPAIAGAKTGSYAVERVLRFVSEGIIEGRFTPGTRIVEPDIARELALGRGPVREAIQILIGRRVLERPPHGSARVRKLSLKDVLDIAEIWSVVGPLASRLAAQRIHVRNNAERLRQAAANMKQSLVSGDSLAQRRAINALIRLIADIGENPYLHNVREALMMEHYQQNIADLVGRDKRNEYAAMLMEAVKAILLGAPEDASAEYIRLMAWVKSVLMQEYEQQRQNAAG